MQVKIEPEMYGDEMYYRVMVSWNGRDWASICATRFEMKEIIKVLQEYFEEY